MKRARIFPENLYLLPASSSETPPPHLSPSAWMPFPQKFCSWLKAQLKFCLGIWKMLGLDRGDLSLPHSPQTMVPSDLPLCLSPLPPVLYYVRWQVTGSSGILPVLASSSPVPSPTPTLLSLSSRKPSLAPPTLILLSLLLTPHGSSGSSIKLP